MPVGGNRTVPAKTGAGSLRDLMAEVRRLRALQHAPHPAWILGAPAIQACAYASFCLPEHAA